MSIDQDHETAIEGLRRVLERRSPDREMAGLLAELGVLESHGEPRAAVRHLRIAVALLEDVRQKARATGHLAVALGQCDQYPEAVELLAAAARSARSIDPQLCLDLELDLVSLARHDIATAPEAGRLLAQTHNVFGETPESRQRIDALRAEHSGVFGDLSPGEIKRLALGVHPPTSISNLRDLSTFYHAVTSLLHVEEHERVLSLCERVLDADLRSLPHAEALAWTCVAKVRHRQGRLPEARECAEVARRTFDISLGTPRFLLAVLDHVTAEISIDLGDMATVRSLLGRLRPPQPLTLYRSLVALHTRGLLHAAVGDPAAALADQFACGDRLRVWGITHHPDLPWRAHAAIADHELGNVDRSLTTAADHVRFARRRGAPRATGLALAAAAISADDSDATALLNEAIMFLSAAGAPLEVAKVKAKLASLALRAGRATYAAALRRTAHVTAQQRSALPLLTLLGSLPGLPDLDPLTPAEQRIAGLAAAGRGNPEIALYLGIARRTVEFHLTNAYRKLGVSTRAELSLVMEGSDDPLPAP